MTRLSPLRPDMAPGSATLPAAIRTVVTRVRVVIGTLWRLGTNSSARWEFWTRLSHSRSVHQDTTLTWHDRYPALFGAVRDLVGDGSSRLLSFGCSSGEEVITLRGYFAHATIVGAELNRGRLRTCRRLPADPAIRFIASERATIAGLGPYDAIFCMAVLQRRPHAVQQSGLADLSRLYSFAHFSAELVFLVSQLRPGGLLIVEHAQYLVEDVADLPVDPVTTHGVALAKGPRFARDGLRIVPQPVIARLFRRR